MHRLARIYDAQLTEDETAQIGRVTVFFNLAALCSLALFATIAYLNYDRRYASILVTFMALSLGNILLFFLTGRVKVLVLMTCFAYLPFCAFLQINGGQNNSAILWHYVYPVMVYYIAGLRLGVLCCGILIVMEASLMWMDDAAWFRAYYPFDFKLRFLATMTTLSIFGAILERSRTATRNKLLLLTKKLEKISETDELTGLANRRALKEILEREVLRSQESQSDFGMVLCDIDHFKTINDRHGHATGDQALRHVAGMLGTLIRKDDRAARWGGEEFLLILPGADLGESCRTAERIRAEIEQTPMGNTLGTSIGLTISCGVSNWSEHRSLSEMFRAADNRLYQAKAMGRNKVVGAACA